jgi:hypothetical protein
LLWLSLFTTHSCSHDSLFFLSLLLDWLYSLDATDLMANAVNDTISWQPPSPKAVDPTLGMSQVPAWIAYDRKVLRFYCYFTETVPLSAVEKERVRPCILYFYLEDDSMHLADVKVVNR